MILINIYLDSLSTLGDLLYKTQKKISKSFLGNSILDIYFCPFLKNPEKSWKKISVVTINYFYRLTTKKIIFILLA
jgi:hypothetical protein